MITYETLKNARDIMDRCLSTGQAIKLTFTQRSYLIAFRHQIYRAREMDRRQSYKAYTPDSEHWGKSQYDSISTRLVPQKLEDEFILIVELTKGELAPGLVKVEEVPPPED